MKRMKVVLSIAVAFLVWMGVPAQRNFAAEEIDPLGMEKTNGEKTMPLAGTKKILVAYFSHSGNTREIADQIHKKVGGDIFEIQSVKPYPGDYDTVVKQAREELDSGYKPALKAKVEDIGAYDVIFIGFPIWWGTFPAPVRTFLSEYDLSGKSIVPFCTHEGSGLEQSVLDISELCPKAILLEGAAIWGRDVKTAQDKVSDWLREIKVIK
ncbi:MAG: flavodoxin [Candidatus Omnitrophica bacterium]|nr:flavodoxin [Candidatus Omnitrophota bacterium]